MNLVIFSSNEVGKMKIGTGLRTRVYNTVRFHSASGEVYKMVFTQAKINKSIEESEKRKGILDYGPIDEKSSFKMNNPTFSSIQKNM